MTEIVETRGTVEKVRRWNRAVKQVASAKLALNSAECELANAQNDLGRWLLPEDAATNEEFNVWIGDGIMAARRNDAPGASSNDYLVRWRKSPSAKAADEMALS